MSSIDKSKFINYFIIENESSSTNRKIDKTITHVHMQDHRGVEWGV